jgi:MOSC domain-containing protein YiiM
MLKNSKEVPSHQNAKIVSINISKEKGGKKFPIAQARIHALGIEGDGHSGKWHRQISMLSLESIERMNEKSKVASPGDFGENLTVEGLDFRAVGIGDILRIKGEKEVILRVTQIGKECKTPCSIYYALGYCIMPLEGVFLEVVSGGAIRTGDSIQLQKQ